MAKFKKAILHANETYHSPDGEVPVTTARLKNWEANFQRVTKAGYAVPVAWDHAADIAGASPVKLSSKGKLPSAKNTVGKLAGFKVAADGSHAEILLDITDPTAKGRCERNEVCVSPIIFDKWADGAKSEYSDLLTHVDLVTWPVDHSQKPFVKVEPGTIACGIRMGLSGKGISRMAFPGEEDEDEKDTDLDGTPDAVDPAPEVPETPEKPENPDMPTDDSGDAIAEAIVAHLDQLGISLPAAWNFKTDAAAEILLTGLKTALKAKQNAEPKEEAEEEEPNNGDDVMQVQDPGYAAMSLQANAAFSFAEKQYRSGIATRMSALLESGRCTPAEAKFHEPTIKAVKLSLGSDGEPAKSQLEMWIESREAVPQGTFWSPEVRTQKLSLNVEQPPSADGSSPEEDAKIVNWALGRKTK
jgi:hypothetical protein